MVYEPAALAWHEHRAQAGGVHEQIVGHQRALLAFLGKHLVRGRRGAADRSRATWRGGWSSPASAWRRRALGRDPLPAPVLARMWWNCWAGLVAYPRARAARPRPAGGAAW